MTLLFRVYQECEDKSMSHMVLDKITIARVMQEYIRWSKEQQQWRYPYHTSDNSKYYIMQYTWVNDYNWTKIYEWDVLIDKKWNKYIVKFKYWQFMATRKRIDNIGDDVEDLNELRNFVDKNKTYIIGNVWDIWKSDAYLNIFRYNTK